jgi:hypothetical protein
LQQAQAAAATSSDALPQSTSDNPTNNTASGSNILTGSTIASLDSQTLQALIDLTQQDSSGNDDSDGVGSAGQNGQTQGVPHHHHHHHGGGGAQYADPSSQDSGASNTTSSTDAFGVAAAGSTDDTSNASLEAALLSA